MKYSKLRTSSCFTFYKGNKILANHSITEADYRSGSWKYVDNFTALIQLRPHCINN